MTTPERFSARLFIAVAALALIVAAHAAAPAQRPAQWAQPVPGLAVENLHRITPTLYRSAQFVQADVAALRQLGIRKVISLRAFHDDEALLAGSGIASQRIPINTWDLREPDLVAALRALRAAETDGPVLIHCQHGADRTGLIVALYRLVFQNWSKAQALDELERGGYGFHAIWTHIPRYIERVDVRRLREQVMCDKC